MKSQKIYFKDLMRSLSLMVILVAFGFFALPHWKMVPSILADNTGIYFFNYAYTTTGFIAYSILTALLLFLSLILLVKVFEEITGIKIIKTKDEKMEVMSNIEYVDIKLSWFTKALIFILALLLSILIFIVVVNV